MGDWGEGSPSEIANRFLQGFYKMNQLKEKKSGKKLKLERFTFKVSTQLKVKIQEHADCSGISASQYIIQLIQKDLGLDPREYR